MVIYGGYKQICESVTTKKSMTTGQMPDKVILMCRYDSQVTQKPILELDITYLGALVVSSLSSVTTGTAIMKILSDTKHSQITFDITHIPFYCTKN